MELDSRASASKSDVPQFEDSPLSTQGILVKSSIKSGSETGNIKTSNPVCEKQAASSSRRVDLKAWASIVLLTLMLVPAMSPTYGLSLIIDDMREHFDTSTTAIGWIISAAWFLTSSFTVISGVFVTPENSFTFIKLGQFVCIVSLYLASKCTSLVTMFCALGIGYGVGCNFVYYAVSIQGQNYFPLKSQMSQCKAASAFTQIALPVGQVISGVAFTYFKNSGNNSSSSSGWQDAIQFSAILLFVVGYICLAIVEQLAKSFNKNQSESKKNAKSNQLQRSTRMKLMSNFKRQFSTQTLKLPAFYWLNLDLFLFWASNLVGLMFLPTEMKANGYAHLQIPILTLQGVSGAVGRLCLSAAPFLWPPKLGSVKFFRLFPSKGAILAVCFLSSFALGSPYSYYVLTVGVGVSSAIAGAPLLNVSQEVLGRKMNAFTWTLLSVGSGGMFGPILGGVVFDLSGSYRLAFEIASTLACVSATLSVLAAISRHSKERKRSMHEERMKRHMSHKHVPLETLAPTLYIKRSPNSYFVFEKHGDKYQYSRIIDKFDSTMKRNVTDVDELFHGKFDITNAYLPYELEDDPMGPNQLSSDPVSSANNSNDSTRGGESKASSDNEKADNIGGSHQIIFQI